RTPFTVRNSSRRYELCRVPMHLRPVRAMSCGRSDEPGFGNALQGNATMNSWARRSWISVGQVSLVALFTLAAQQAAAQYSVSLQVDATSGTESYQTNIDPVMET